MEVFDFPFHLLSEEYPESSYKVQFGGGYEFASEPNAPDQVIYKLNFPAMWFFTNSAGALNLSVYQRRNMGKLREFYKTHRLSKYFLYPHPVDGNLRVRFQTPLVVPNGVPNGYGRVEPFEIKLRLQP